MSNSKNSIKNVVIASAVAFSLLAGSAVIAKGPNGKKGGGHNRIERMIETLDLTDDQITQVEALMSSRKEARGSKKENRAQIKELIDQGLVDQAAELAATHARENIYDMVEFKNSLNAILTPEQITKMEENKQKRKERKEARKQKRKSQ